MSIHYTTYHGVVYTLIIVWCILYCVWQTKLTTIVFDSLPITSVSLYHALVDCISKDECDVS